MSRLVPLTAECLDWVQQIGATDEELLDYFRAINDYLHGRDPQPKERVVKGILFDQLRRWAEYTEKVEAKQRAQSQAASKTNAKRWPTAEGNQPQAAPPSQPQPAAATQPAAPPTQQPAATQPPPPEGNQPRPSQPNRPPATSHLTRLMALYERWGEAIDGKICAWHDTDPAAAAVMLAIQQNTETDKRADIIRCHLEKNQAHTAKLCKWTDWGTFWALANAIATTPAAPRPALAQVFDSDPTPATAAALVTKIEAIRSGKVHAPAAFILAN